MPNQVVKLARLVQIALVLTFLLGNARSASAQDACLSELYRCFESAATREAFWDRTIAGLDCQFVALDCIRRSLIGR